MRATTVATAASPVMFSDVRIFLNTISNAFDTMKSAGIDARMEKTETGDAYVYEIRIPKSAVYKNAAP